MPLMLQKMFGVEQLDVFMQWRYLQDFNLEIKRFPKHFRSFSTAVAHTTVLVYLNLGKKVNIKLIQTHQLLNFLTSSFNPPKNPWDVQKIASYTRLMTACPRHWLRLKPCRRRWLKRKCWRRRRCQSIEMEAVGRVGSWFRNAGGLGNVFLVPKTALNYGVFCFETWVGFVFSLEGC